MCEAELGCLPLTQLVTSPQGWREMALGGRTAICPAPAPTLGLNRILLPLDFTPRLGFSAASGRREAEAGASRRRNRAQTSGLLISQIFI